MYCGLSGTTSHWYPVHDVQPQVRTRCAAILKATVASCGDFHFDAQVEVANGRVFPGEEAVHLERAVRHAGDRPVFHRPVFRIAAPLPQRLAIEDFDKSVGVDARPHGGGRLWTGRCRCAEGAWQRLKRTAKLFDSLGGAPPHGLQGFGVLGIVRQVDQLVGVALQIVQKLIVVVVEISHVFEAIVSQAFKRGDAASHREVLMEGLGSPIIRRFRRDNRLQAAALITLRGRDASPVEKRGGQVQVQRDGVAHFSLLISVYTRVGDDERHTQRLVVVRPFARQPAIAHVVTVVSGVNDDRIVREAGLLKRRHKAANGAVDAADHAVVGSHVGLVFFAPCSIARK